MSIQLNRTDVWLMQSQHTDQYGGVPEELERRGLSVCRLEGERVLAVPPPRVIVVSEVCSFATLANLRRAGCPSILLMDGVVEYRNTHHAPGTPERFLRPAPVDVVACVSEHDARLLRDLGNRAVATGLPRLEPFRPMPPGDGILVATALKPAFGEEERRRLLDLLASVRETLGDRVRWRLTDRLDLELGVENDDRPLLDVLRDVDRVLTTPSTLAIEAQRCGRPTALLHPWDAPVWPQASAAIRDASDVTSVVESLSSMDVPEDVSVENAVWNLADLVEAQLRAPVRISHPPEVRSPTRLDVRVAPRGDRPRVLSVVRCHESIVGGVCTWSRRLAQAIDAHGYDMHTLIVSTHTGSLVRDPLDDRTHNVVIDRTLPTRQVIQNLRQCIEAFDPTIVLPNYTDMSYLVATQLRTRGVRTVAIAHTHDAYYQTLMSMYGTWDGCVGVSTACMDWLEPLAGERPISRIVYGVPVAESPRVASRSGPIRLAYIGRMEEPQKRISRLHDLIRALEERQVPFELHMVGDGSAMKPWRDDLAPTTCGTIQIHGRRTPEWVQALLRRIDVSLLVSDYEGTSITMLESMGAGVVPVVTRVESGVEDWIEDGVNGHFVEIGDIESMADRIAALESDRDALDRLGRRAWDTVRERLSIDGMARSYASLFDDVLATPHRVTPTDTVARLIESDWEHRLDDEALPWAKDVLREAGFTSIGTEVRGEGDDAVILTAGSGVAERVSALRAEGVGAVVVPGLLDDADALTRLRRAVIEATERGRSRLAIFGLGAHTQRASDVILEGRHPIIGFIDDRADPGAEFLGLPVRRLEDVGDDLRPDCIILSSDAWEEQMWTKTESMRSRGVDVQPLYGTYD